MLLSLVNIPKNLQPKTMTGGAITVAEQKRIKKYGSLKNYNQAMASKKIQDEINSLGLDKVSTEAEYIKKYNLASAEAKKYLESPAELKARLTKEGYYEQQNKYEAEKKTYEAAVREQAEWKQADKLAGKIQLGQGGRYDPRSSIGKKINYLLDLWASKGYRTAPPKLKKVENTLIEPNIIEPSFYNKVSTGKIIFTQEQLEANQKVLSTIAPNYNKPKPADAYNVPLPKEQNYYNQGTQIVEPKKMDMTPDTTFKPSVLYLGGKEYQTSIQPNYGTKIDSGFSNVGEGQRVNLLVRPIEPDYTQTVEKRVIESIPFGGGVALSSMNENIYIPNPEDAKKLNKILSSNKPFAARDLRIFLREQEAKLKRDLGRYNQLNLKSQSEQGLTDAEFKEAEALRKTINQGQRGNLGDVVYSATETATRKGTRVNLFDSEVTPRTARWALNFGTSAFNLEKNVLAYQVGGVIVGGALGASKAGTSVLNVISKVSKPLKYTTAPVGLGVGYTVGAQEFSRRGDLGDAIFAGAGASAGFFGAVYSRQIVEAPGKLLFGADAAVNKIPPIGGDKRGTLGRQKSIYDREEEYLARKKGITFEQIEKIENARTYLRGAKKKEVFDFVKKQLELIKNTKGISEAEKLNRARGLRIFLEETLDQRIFVTPNQLSNAKPEVIDLLDKTFPQKTEATRKVFETISPYYGTGQYERSDSIYVGQLQRPGKQSLSNGLLYGVKNALDTNQDLSSKTKQTPKTGQNLYTSPIQIPRTDVIQEPRTGQDLITTPIQSPETVTRQKPKTETVQTPISRNPVPVEIRIGLPPRPQVEPPYPFGIPVIRGQPTSQQYIQPYYGQVMVNGKYQTVTNKKQTKSGALDKIARIIDNTVSAQGRIVPVEKKKIKRSEASGGDGYYESTKNKFRGFKMFKGRQVKLNNTLIEKKNKRLDTPGETSGLTVAQFKSQGKLGRPKKLRRFRL